MTDDRTFERAARSWIEAGPSRAPDHVVERALLLVQTTPQERGLRAPWRVDTMPTFARVAAAAAIGVLVVGGVLLTFGRPGQAIGPPATPSVLPSAAPSESPRAQPAERPVDYSDLNGRILMEHLGNAPDLSEANTTDFHPERRRLYFMDPATMTGDTAVEFLPGQPAEGKLNADVSADGQQVAFMDTADPARIWIAGTDGSDLQQLSDCDGCSELDPAFDPTGTKIAFVHLEGAWRLSRNGSNGNIEVRDTENGSWIAIRDLATGEVTTLEVTRGPGDNLIPEQPSWSPDGTRIVFHRTDWNSSGMPIGGSLEIVDVGTGEVVELPTAQADVPGDGDWSPDGSTIVFTDYPWSSTGSLDIPPASIHTIRPDDPSPVRLTGGAGASWMSDGRIIYMNNVFYIMNADGSGNLPVNADGMDLSELEQGFAYIPHWIDGP